MRNKQSTLLYRWFEEVWNQDKEDSIDELMTGDGIAHGLSSEESLTGAPGFKVFYRGFREQFEDIHIDVHDVVSQDDMECGLTEVTAKHRDTGKKVNFSGICMVRVKDGKIAEAWNHYDFLNLNQQLGQTLAPQEAV